MNDELAPTRVPMTLWLIGGAGLIWNLLGTWIFINSITVTPEQLAEIYDAAQIEFLQAIPLWATLANGLAVATGVIGCLFLLLRRTWALNALLISVVALIIQDVYSFVVVDATAVFGAVPAYIAGAVMVIQVLLVIYTLFIGKSGLLR